MLRPKDLVDIHLTVELHIFGTSWMKNDLSAGRQQQTVAVVTSRVDQKVVSTLSYAGIISRYSCTMKIDYGSLGSAVMPNPRNE